MSHNNAEVRPLLGGCFLSIHTRRSYTVGVGDKTFSNYGYVAVIEHLDNDYNREHDYQIRNTKRRSVVFKSPLIHMGDKTESEWLDKAHEFVRMSVLRMNSEHIQ